MRSSVETVGILTRVVAMVQASGFDERLECMQMYSIQLRCKLYFFLIELKFENLSIYIDLSHFLYVYLLF